MSASDLPKPLQTLLTISKLNCVKINLSKQDNDFLPTTSSQVGGMGYLPIGETYPTKADGTPLVLLAQLNFRQLGAVVEMSQLSYPLPKQGILQIYIDGQDDNYLYGADFDNQLPSKTYQVRFWQDDSLPINADELTQIAERLQGFGIDKLPFDFRHQYAMDFALTSQSCTTTCHEYNHISQKIDELAGVDVWDYLEEELKIDDADEVLMSYDELANSGGHQILGYPIFTQTDPREYEGSLQEHILLLQIDTDDENDIIWGDSGVANFFIHPKDLKEQNFSKLIYNWDCY
ncbi:YwqG family protein [Moraxella cuniculi]|uniref:Domain of uncharacterized function (DUF1963) n=1 Tax=Moraxella cuniculi TaxID=34061 RepID=A0A3S4ULL0_9GAMM|nr:DUF1963 domain-containing protein [Moraxella cuniculi]VEG13645.1 Domain of uncharacterised function (DUF1963) [Moraxella cuniculi]